MDPNAFCIDCGWPVVFANTNYEFKDYKDAREWDWWMYCSNKGCKNHEGEGKWQDDPDWVSYANKKRRLGK
jgi:hypothetical protein